MWEGGGSQSSRPALHLKLHPPVMLLPNFSLRQLPSASVGFLGLPSPNILFNSDNMTCGRVGRQLKSLVHFFSLNYSFRRLFAQF